MSTVSNSASALIGPVWFLSCVAIVQFVSVAAGVSVALLTMVAAIVFRSGAAPARFR